LRIRKVLTRTVHRKDIQTLRGLAVLSVVLYHAFPEIVPNGYLGVDLFFVISGFVITPRIISAVSTQNGTLLEFYRKRFYRLFPAFIFSMLFSTFLIFLFARVSEHKKFANQAFASLVGMANLGAIRFSGDYFNPNPNPLLHIWSLAVEFQIYLFLPLIFFVVGKFDIIKKNNLKLQLILICISLILFLYLQGPSRELFNFSSREIQFYSPITRFWEFGLGGIIHSLMKLPNSMKFIKINQKYFFTTICLISFTPLNFVPLGMQLAITLLTTLAIINGDSANLKSKSNIYKSFSYVGDWSYSIYLVHLPILYVATYSDIFSDKWRVILKLFAIPISLILGFFSFVSVENRFYPSSRKSATLNNCKISVLASAAFLVLISLVVMEIFSKSGYGGIAETKAFSPGFVSNSRSKCFVDTPRGDPCVFSRNSEKTLMLVGDSHAAHFSNVIFDLTQKFNWNLIIWTHGGCNVDFFSTHSNSSEQSDCKINNNMLQKYLIKNRVKAIILSNDLPATSLLHSIEKSTLWISAHTDNLLVVGQTPIFPDPHFRDASSVVKGKTNWKVSFPINSMVSEKSTNSREYMDWAKHHNLNFFNPSPLFCNSGFCTRQNAAKVWLYSDTGHLDSKGAELFLPQFSSWLNSVGRN